MIEERFQQLLDEAQELFAGGDLDGALDLFSQAEEFARGNGETDLADRAYCNAAFVRINETGLHEQEIPGLRRLYMRSDSNRNRWSACYSLAVAFDLLGNSEDALDWANRASDLGALLEDSKVCNRGNSLSAILALKASRLEEAEEYLTRCLQGDWNLNEPIERINLAHARANMGYLMFCQERIEEGLESSHAAAAALQSEGADHILYQTYQDLCFGNVLADELDRAQHFGEKALALAEKHDDLQVMKNCLFLLSETAVRRGDTFRARRYLRELTNFYPEIEMNEEIIDVFLATDLTNVVNLRG